MKDDKIDKIFKIYEVIAYSIGIIASAFVCFYVLNLQFKNADLTTKIILTPFTLCILYTMGLFVARLFHKDKLEKIFLKSYVVTFLLLWFGLVGFATYSAINDNQLSMILFLIPFYVVGIYAFYKYIIKG